jgi:PAS domain S-box-containing protein
MPRTLRALLVEDVPSDAELLLEELSAGGFDVTHERVQSAAAMKAALEREPWDIVFSDYSMPGFDAPAAIAVLRNTGLDIPLIIVSGTVGEETAVQAMKAGAHDYFRKDKLSPRLVPVVERELREAANRKDRRRAVHALAEKEAQYRQIVDSVRAIVWRADARTFRFTFVSPEAEKILGYPLSTWTEDARFWVDHIHPDDREWVVPFCRENTRVGRDHQFEYRMMAADGHAVHFQDLVRVVTEGGEASELVGIINNLLGVIIGYADIVLREIGPEQRAHHRVKEMRSAAERAAALTRQLLAFSRKQVLQPKVLDPNAVVANVETMLRRLIGEHIQLVTILPERLGAVKADPGQLEQVVLNLAVNARDAMPGGGRIVMETANAELDEAYVKTHPDARAGPHVVLSVSDSGHGMDAATIAHIFEPFFTTKGVDKGTGLGLSTVYGIVRQSGGHVTVYSEPGQGAVFKVYLPRVDAPLEPPVEPASSQDDSGHETVLLAEDDPGLRAMVAEVLEGAGYVVLEAASPEVALELAESHAGPIHVLMTDVVMPRIGGNELSQHVRARRPEVRVLFASGYSFDAVGHQGLIGPDTNFLEKPFTAAALLRRLRRILDSKPPL